MSLWPRKSMISWAALKSNEEEKEEERKRGGEEERKRGRALPEGKEGNDPAPLHCPGEAQLKCPVHFWAPQDSRDMELLEQVDD